MVKLYKNIKIFQLVNYKFLFCKFCLLVVLDQYLLITNDSRL